MSLLYHIIVNMSREIYNVNKLFTIKRVSGTCKRLDIDRWNVLVGDVNRMECGMGKWMGKVGEDGVVGLGLSLVKSGLRRLCVVSATTESCCKCNTFIQKPPPG